MKLNFLAPSAVLVSALSATTVTVFASSSTIRGGVAITSESSTDYFQVKDMLDEDNILATNIGDQLVLGETRLKDVNSESEPDHGSKPDLVFYHEGASASTGEDEDSELFNFETVHSNSIKQQSIRGGVAITSDSVDSSSDYSQVKAVLEDTTNVAVNFGDHLVEDTLKEDVNSEFKPDLVFYHEGASASKFETEHSNSINSLHEDEMGIKSFLDLNEGNEDLISVTLTDREINIDLEFPHGTSLSIISHDGTILKTHQVCDVALGTDNKPMIANRAKYGLGAKDWIQCAFHVVFPGHSDECDCKLKIANESFFCKSDTSPIGPFLVYQHTLYVDGCDCIHITAFEPPGETPKEGLVWPCGVDPRKHFCPGCYYAPQMKLIVASN
ncbi:hypothetical protein ACHAXM_008990 [Skeletonema potamos]